MFTINKDQIKAHLAQFDGPPRWRQPLLRLTRIVTIETRRRCMCIPDRESAKEEARQIEQKFRGTVSDIRITKNGKGPKGTYSVGYTLTETKTEALF